MDEWMKHSQSSNPLTEDNKLINWKKWLADRKRHYKAFGKALKRNKDELLLNSGEKYRFITETRELMEYAAEPLTEAYLVKNIDLGFWITPEILPNHGNPNLPEIQVPLKKKLNVIPTIVHVACPDLILEEKGLSKPSAFRNKYLEERTNELAQIISIIEPKPPEMENLFVQGKNFGKSVVDKKNNIQNIPVIIITTAEETEKETSEWSINPDAMIASLRIENMEIQRRLNPRFGYQKKDGCQYQWDIKFESKVSEEVEKHIFFENKGNMKITFYWTLPDLISSSSILSRKKEKSSFIFRKGKSIILPGQILQFPIWFKSCQPGKMAESWKLETDPILSSGEFIFKFWGVCTEDENARDKVKEIIDYLNIQMRDSAIMEILEEIVYDVLRFQPPEPPYRNFFLDRDIFSVKNPSYFYHSSLIKEFREIFKNNFNSNDSEWNLSLSDLQKLLLEIGDPEIRQRSLVRFVDTSRASLEPSLLSSINNQQCENVYNVLCSFFNQFEVESESIKSICFGSCELETELLTVDSSDQSRSNSLSTKSSESLTPKSNVKSKKKLQRTSLSLNSKEEKSNKWIISKPRDVILYREIFYLTIYELLGEAISKACAVIDSYVRLNEPEK